MSLQVRQPPNVITTVCPEPNATPRLRHAEDTFLLLDALEADLETLKGVEPRICLEIG